MLFQGMGGFSGASVSSLDLSHSTRDSLVATANVVLRNPSIIRIGPLGEFGINASMGVVQVGSFRSARWVDEIGPGDNTISVMGGMNSQGGGSAMNGLISSFLSGKDVELDTVITDSSIPLVQSTMAGLQIPARLRQGKAMELLGDVTFKAMSLSQSPTGQGAVIAATLDIGFVSPLGRLPYTSSPCTQNHANKAKFAYSSCGIPARCSASSLKRSVAIVSLPKALVRL